MDFFESDTQNIAELLSEEKLKEVYLQVSQKYQDDYSAMGDKIDKLRSYVKLASLISERDKPFQGASDVVFPLASTACIQYGSTAYQALFPDDNIAKVKIIGDDKGTPAMADGKPIVDPQTGQIKMQFVGNKQKIGRRISTMINYQLNDLLHYWKTDAIKSMYRLPAIGTMFKKTYWDFIRDQPASYFIYPDKIILNPAITCIEENVWSEVLDLDKKAIISNIKAGLWKEYDFETSQTSTETPNTIQENKPKTNNIQLIEQHTYLDLDEDGLDEPYAVTFDMGAQVIVRIAPDYDLDGVKKRKGKIYYIERNECLTYFGFLPSFDGSFYSVGYAELLSNNNAAVNTTINQLLDAGSLRNKGGGFIATGIDLRGGAMTFKLGEYKKVNVAGGNLAANVFPFPFPEPSQVIFALLGLLIESGKEIGSLRDVLTGDTAANMAPTTYMGLVEQGMKQSIAILKNNHESFKKELKIIRKLNRKYLSNSEYKEVNGVEEVGFEDVTTKDFSEKNCDVVLVSDTNSMTSAQKLAQAQLLLTLKDDPFYDQIQIRKMFNEAVQMAQLNEIVAAPAPSPDANLIFAQAEDKKAQAKLSEAQIKAVDTTANIEEKAYKLQLVDADIKLKETEALKNVSEIMASEEEFGFKKVLETEKLLDEKRRQELEQQRTELNETKSDRVGE